MRKKIMTLVLAGVLTVTSVMVSPAFYQPVDSIKGIHVTGIGSYRTCQDLGVKQAIWNVRVNDIARGIAAGEDRMLQENKEHGISNTIIIQNQWQTDIPALLPVSEPAAGAVLYSFHVSTEENRAAVRSIAKTWANRYRNLVSNWIIGNEINDGNAWNYSAQKDLTAYTTDYAAAFRIWYEEIKAANPDARVFIPFDYRWNWPGGNGAGYYQAKDMLPILNSQLGGTDYGIAWHAYPQDLADPVFADDAAAADTPDAPIINMKNLHVLTDFMQQSEYLSPEGKVRHLILSEQGFSSNLGEDRQAEAIAAAYEAAKANPYVEAFFLNRDQDLAGGEMGHNFGLMNADGSRKAAYDVYKNLN